MIGCRGPEDPFESMMKPPFGLTKKAGRGKIKFLLPYKWILVLFMAVNSKGVFAQTQTIQVAGVSRNYILYAPTGLSHPPLVFVFHGYGMDGAQEVGLTKMNAVADREKFIVAYPNGIGKSWDMTGPNDYALVFAIIDSVDAKYHIDRNRIYASGFSLGGFMAFQLGCRYADKFAAISPVSGRLQGNCTPQRAIPLLSIFGTKDAAPAPDMFKEVMTWVNLDGCPTTPTVTRPYPAGNLNGKVTHMKFGPCKDGTEVIADTVSGGPHEWPMDTQSKMNASEEIWGFFKRFALNSTTRLLETEASKTPEGLRLTYANGAIRMLGANAPATVRVMDTGGRLVLASTATLGWIPFKDRPSGVYQVLVTGKNGTQAYRVAIP